MQHPHLIPDRQLLRAELVAGLVGGLELQGRDGVGPHGLRNGGLMAALQQVPDLWQAKVDAPAAANA